MSQSYKFIIETFSPRHEVTVAFPSREKALAFFNGFIYYFVSDRDGCGKGLDFSARGNRFAYLWEFFAAKYLELSPPVCAVFAPDGTRLAKANGTKRYTRPELVHEGEDW